MISSAARLSRLFAAALAVAAALELLVARGMLFLRHERLRAGLPYAGDWWWRLGSYVTTFTGLLAVATVVTLGLRLATSRLPSAGRGLGLGFATTIAALGLAALFVPPDVRGILTIHLAVVLGGTTVGVVLLLTPGPWTLKATAGAPLLLPPLGTAALAMQGSAQPVLRAALIGLSVAVALAVAVAAAFRVSVIPRAARLVGIAHALAVACLVAAAVLLQPQRTVEFILFSHGMLLDFRGALAVLAVVVLAVSFASAALVLEPRTARPADGDGRLLGLGLLLSFLAGPSPLNGTQSLVLAAGSLALIAGALDQTPPVPPRDSFEPDEPSASG
jgi:hypothetical protein